MTATTSVSLTTTTTAMGRLGLNREQVDRLVRVGLLPIVGSHGRTRLLDPAALAVLAARPYLSTTKKGRLAALAVHLGPLALDPRPEHHRRHVTGWDVQAPVPDSAWAGWWGTGTAIADAVVGLPLLPAVSGFIVTVRQVTGWNEHLTDPGLIGFETKPPSAEMRQQFINSRFRVDPGTVWQRLYV